MESLAHVGCKDEVILVFLVGIVYTEPFPGRVSKPCNNVGVQQFGLLEIGRSFKFY